MMFKCLRKAYKLYRCCRRGDCIPETTEILTASGMDTNITTVPSDGTVPIVTQHMKFESISEE